MLEAKITHARSDIRISDKDHAILAARVAAYNQYDGPRVGDFIRFSDGMLHRFSHHWGDSIQTSRADYDVSFYLGEDYISFSGSLNPAIDIEDIHATPEIKLGSVWFFHNGYVAAHSAVYAQVPFRVYETALTSDWWKRPDTGLSGIDHDRTSKRRSSKRRSSRKLRK